MTIQKLSSLYSTLVELQDLLPFISDKYKDIVNTAIDLSSEIIDGLNVDSGAISWADIITKKVKIDFKEIDYLPKDVVHQGLTQFEYITLTDEGVKSIYSPVVTNPTFEYAIRFLDRCLINYGEEHYVWLDYIEVNEDYQRLVNSEIVQVCTFEMFYKTTFQY
jgi:hypothetical protein